MNTVVWNVSIKQADMTLFAGECRFCSDGQLLNLTPISEKLFTVMMFEIIDPGVMSSDELEILATPLYGENDGRVKLPMSGMVVIHATPAYMTVLEDGQVIKIEKN
jgi:hypothetical protein